MKLQTKDLIRTMVAACLGVAALAGVVPARAQVVDSNNTARLQPSAVLVPSDLKPESAPQPERGRGLPQPKMPAPTSERRSSTWERFGRQQPFVVVSDKTNVVIRSAKEEVTARTGALGPAAVLVPSDLKLESAPQPESGRGLPQPKMPAPASEGRSSTWERFGRRQPSAFVSQTLDQRGLEQPRRPVSDAHQNQEPRSRRREEAEASVLEGDRLLTSAATTGRFMKKSSQSDRPGVVADTTTIARPSLPDILPQMLPIVPSSALGSNVASAWLPPPFVPAPVVFDTAHLTAAVTNRVTLPSRPKEPPPPSPSAPSAALGSNAAPSQVSSTLPPAPAAPKTNRLSKATQAQAAGSSDIAVPPAGGANAVKPPPKAGKPTERKHSTAPRSQSRPTTSVQRSLPEALPPSSPSTSSSALGSNAAPAWLATGFEQKPAATQTVRVAATATSPTPRPTPTKDPAPSSPTASSSATPQLPADLKPLVDEARELFSQKKFEEAAAKYREILKRDPENLFGLSNLAVIRFQQERLEEAEHLLNRALQIAPDDAYSHATIGIIYFKQDRIDDAVEELTRSLKLNADNAEAHNYLGIASWKKGWSSAAEQELRRAIELRPDYPDAHYNLAVIYTSPKSPFLGLARFHYRKTLELGRPPDPDLEKILAGGKPEK
ncbi:MAG: tetratricopeptide repeat protein [Verrucomicrobia bacterium]|nr:tetratricopeptide repeat protein [Verrucomicrobiota bacterium]